MTRYDLITAAVLTDDFDLRERTNADIVDPLRQSFGEIAETSIPQTLALNIKGNTEHITQMELAASDIQQVWDETTECFFRAVDFAKQNFGVVNSDFSTIRWDAPSTCLLFLLRAHKCCLVCRT